MLFSSLTFLYYFLPLTVGLYFLAPGRMKNTVLLLTSLLFYAWGEPRYVFLMGLSIFSGYCFGREAVRQDFLYPFSHSQPFFFAVL